MVAFERGGKHWHGAALTLVLAFIAALKQRDGKVDDRIQPASEQQPSVEPKPK